MLPGLRLRRLRFVLRRVAIARLERRRSDDGGNREVAIADRAFDTLGQGDAADVDRIADVEAGDVDADFVGDLVRFADGVPARDERCSAHAATLQAGRGFSLANTTGTDMDLASFEMCAGSPRGSGDP